MASIRKIVHTTARTEDVWAAIADIGALHTRLVPGFVIDTKLEPGARIVTFGNGMVVREPIISVDPTARRLVWTASGGRATHYNSSVEVTAGPAGGSMVTWTSDFLPDSLEAEINGAMEMGAGIMAKTLNKLSV